MLNLSEENYLKDHAYIPEHLPCYVVAVSNCEPFISDDFVFYQKNKTLIFIGYPISKEKELDFQRSLYNTVKKFKPK